MSNKTSMTMQKLTPKQKKDRKLYLAEKRAIWQKKHRKNVRDAKPIRVSRSIYDNPFKVTT